jgi:hypothetical protein
VSQGWRTFRVRTAADALQGAEFVCPASHEAGQKVTCKQCKACGGADGRKGSPVIIAHGALAKRFVINIIPVVTVSHAAKMAFEMACADHDIHGAD